VYTRVEQTNILSRLVERLKLKSSTPAGAALYLSPVVLAVTDISTLLATAKTQQSTTVDLSGGAGGYVAVFTVPTLKRWLILSWYRNATTASSSVSIKVAGVTSQRSAGGTNAEVGLDNAVLQASDSIGLAATGNVGDNARVMTIHYLEEDAY